MRKFKFLFFLPLLFCTSLQATELYTTAVQKALSEMLNPAGKFNIIYMADGTSFDTAPGGSGATAFSALTGSATASQLPSVIRLPGTTTEQSAGAYGQFYVYSGDRGNFLTAEGGVGTNTTATMTGFASPSPNIVEQSGNYDTTYGWCAFDNDTVSWLNNNAGIGWISYNYGTGNVYAIKEYRMKTGNTAHGPNTWDFQGSNNNVSWTTIDHRSGVTWAGTSTYQSYTVATSTTKYQMYKINVTAGNDGTYLRIDQMLLLELLPVEYTLYSLRYDDPINGNAVLRFDTTGTASTEKSFIYNNATTTVFASGTNTAVTGTTTLYSGYTPAGKGSWYCDGYNTSSESKTKTGIYLDPYKEMQKYCYNALLQGNVVEWQRLDETKEKYSLEDVENQTKERYKSQLYTTWEGKNKASYTSSVFDAGGSSTTTIDSAKMKSDFNAYSEVEWAGELDQVKLIRGTERELMGNGIDRIGYIADAPETPILFKLPDGSGLSLDNQIGGLQLGFREIVERLDKATAEITKLKAMVNP